ncbi:lysophospholipase-like protein 1 [Epinephelus lanceolatus]
MVPDLAFRHIRVIYPTAPAWPYTPMQGALSTVWFDRQNISRDCPEHQESIDSMCNTLGSIIQDEVNAGIPKHRLIIDMIVCRDPEPRPRKEEGWLCW